MCHSSTGSLGCGGIGSHHRSGAATKNCTLQSDQPLFRRSRGRRGALSYRNAHRYVPVLLQRIKLFKGPAWRQGGWAIMAQIDGRPNATTKSRWRTLGAAGIRKAPRASTFPKMMARRLAGGAAHQDAAKRRRRLACFDGPTVGPCLTEPETDHYHDGFGVPLLEGKFREVCKKDGRGRWWWDHEGGQEPFVQAVGCCTR